MEDLAMSRDEDSGVNLIDVLRQLSIAGRDILVDRLGHHGWIRSARLVCKSMREIIDGSVLALTFKMCEESRDLVMGADGHQRQPLQLTLPRCNTLHIFETEVWDWGGVERAVVWSMRVNGLPPQLRSRITSLVVTIDSTDETLAGVELTLGTTLSCLPALKDVNFMRACLLETRIIFNRFTEFHDEGPSAGEKHRFLFDPLSSLPLESLTLHSFHGFEGVAAVASTLRRLAVEGRDKNYKTMPESAIRILSSMQQLSYLRIAGVNLKDVSLLLDKLPPRLETLELEGILAETLMLPNRDAAAGGDHDDGLPPPPQQQQQDEEENEDEEEGVRDTVVLPRIILHLQQQQPQQQPTAGTSAGAGLRAGSSGAGGGSGAGSGGGSETNSEARVISEVKIVDRGYPVRDPDDFNGRQGLFGAAYGHLATLLASCELLQGRRLPRLHVAQLLLGNGITPGPGGPCRRPRLGPPRWVGPYGSWQLVLPRALEDLLGRCDQIQVDELHILPCTTVDCVQHALGLLGCWPGKFTLLYRSVHGAHSSQLSPLCTLSVPEQRQERARQDVVLCRGTAAAQDCTTATSPSGGGNSTEGEEERSGAEALLQSVMQSWCCSSGGDAADNGAAQVSLLLRGGRVSELLASEPDPQLEAWLQGLGKQALELVRPSEMGGGGANAVATAECTGAAAAACTGIGAAATAPGGGTAAKATAARWRPNLTLQVGPAAAGVDAGVSDGNTVATQREVVGTYVPLPAIEAVLLVCVTAEIAAAFRALAAAAGGGPEAAAEARSGVPLQVASVAVASTGNGGAAVREWSPADVVGYAAERVIRQHWRSGCDEAAAAAMAMEAPSGAAAEGDGGGVLRARLYDIVGLVGRLDLLIKGQRQLLC
ncbi:hypothetical protein PLESTB_000616400 [Pleodorina starrii]|uniref:Uncharacterized protein n=1 Tax=Pleodorina starrii TaxID=330485 RepID=A0A9W6BHX4_9CHLO|nr:hypothetical protein PLESTM_001736600 [Pleodorina starrii]GLC52323.1 hypothetical protein PLESTB_000616400 [Pleodorina starrii]GLC68006.1 hypothetical protein PLESTF_000633800 [Pleodorina starrii]